MVLVPDAGAAKVKVPPAPEATLETPELSAPIPFFRVRFIDTATWTGVGKVGNVVGTNANSKKTKRLDW